MGSSELKRNSAKVEDQKTTSQKAMSYVSEENDHQLPVAQVKGLVMLILLLPETETDVINFQVNDSRIFFGLNPPMNSPPLQSQLTKNQHVFRHSSTSHDCIHGRRDVFFSHGLWIQLGVSKNRGSKWMV